VSEPNFARTDIPATEFARLVLSMPEPVALGFLRQYHNRTCKCGMDGGPDGPVEGPKLTLISMRMHWKGRL
jgi:hypothetical protein